MLYFLTNIVLGFGFHVGFRVRVWLVKVMSPESKFGVRLVVNIYHGATVTRAFVVQKLGRAN